jgi:hypothetical protein
MRLTICQTICTRINGLNKYRGCYWAHWLGNFVVRWFFGWVLIWLVVHSAFGLAIICLKRWTVILVCLRVAILVLCFLIVDINDMLDIFENVRVLAYADDLKLYMRVSSTDDCRLFQQDFNLIQGWCREKKYDLNAGKCKSISFSRGSKPAMFHWR